MLATTPSRIAASLIQDGPTHRADLARRLSISRTAVTNAVSALMEQGLVSAEPRPSDGATLKDGMHLSPKFGLFAAVVIDFDETVVGVGTPDGRLLETATTPADPRARGEELTRGAAETVRELVARIDEPATLLGTLLAVNTQADRDTGEVLGGTASAAWADTNPKALMEQELEVPVHLENTARLLALAEQLDRPGVNDLLYVQLSYGVAMGLVVEGSILGGSRGGAGELGHMSIDLEGRECTCSGRGCLMQYLGRDALAAEAAQALGPGADVPDLVRAGREGDPAAVTLLGDLGVRAGEMLTGLCNLLEPTTLVIGGCLGEAGELFLGPVRTTLRERALPLAADALEVENATGSLVRTMVLDAALLCLRRDASLRAEVVSRSLATTRTRRTRKVS